MTTINRRNRRQLILLEWLDRLSRWLPHRFPSRVLLTVLGPKIYGQFFDPVFYLESHQDLSGININPWKHFLRHGRFEGRRTSPKFDPTSYQGSYPDISWMSVDCLLHFLLHENVTEWLDSTNEIEPPVFDKIPDQPHNAEEVLRIFFEGTTSKEKDSNPPHYTPVLVFDARFPDVNRDAGSQRMFSIIRILTELGYQVVFVSLDDRFAPDGAAFPSNPNVVFLGGLAAVLNYLADSSIRPDRVLIARPNVALHVVPLLNLLLPDCRVVYDTVDLHWRRLSGQMEFDQSVTSDDINAVRAIENYAFAAAETVLALTSEDAEAILLDQPNVDVAILPLIAPTASRGRIRLEREGVVFVGSFSHLPNRDAARIIIEFIAPALLERSPEIKIEIIGSGFDELRDVPELPNLTIRGDVIDLDTVLQSSVAMIVPLRFGAGMKGKVVSAMVNGLPVVTTSIGAEGMDLVDGDTCIVAGTVDELITGLMRLNGDSQLWNRIAANAATHIVDICSEDRARVVLQEMFLLPETS